MTNAPAVFSANASAPSAPLDAGALSWRVHGLRERPARLVLVVASYGAALGLWRMAFPHPVALFLPVVALTSALSEYLFPQTFRLDARGASAVNGPFARTFIAWADVKRATYGDDGVHLSPLARPSRLDRFRGVRLSFAGGDADAILEAVRAYRAAPPATQTGEASA